MLDKLHPRLKDIVINNKWPSFTDIQIAAFDPIYAGENCILEAPTSGGKTEAVLFPLISKIATLNRGSIKILYIAPLKALLNDIEIRTKQYSNACSLTSFKWHGDVSQAEKIKEVTFPSDILLTTPESLEAILLRKGNWVHVFSQLQTVIIDEAHYFALSDRGSHLMSLLDRMDQGTNALPQRIAMTATIGNPEELLEWLKGKNRNNGEKIVVKTRKEKEKDFKVLMFDSDDADRPSLNSTLYDLLFNKKSIVFRNSRSKTEDSAKYINERNKQLQRGLPVNVRTHHSSVSKYLRESAEALIKMKSESALNAIISTSTLELGIDIGQLDQVVQIGELTSSGSFLQRVGRTGRREGKPQFFRGLCEDPEEVLLLSACINLGLNNISESIFFPRKSYHILAHQIICLCLQDLGANLEKIWNTFSKTYCFSNIPKEKFVKLVDNMIKEDYLRLINGVVVTSDKTENQFLRANWKRLFAVFDTGPMYTVVDGKKTVGTLDFAFASTLKAPFLFLLGGIEWKAIKINHETQQISVKKNFSGEIPKWSVMSNFDIPFEIAKEVGRILTTKDKLKFLDSSALIALEKQREVHEDINWGVEKWIINEDDDKIYIWTFAGDKVNRTLTYLIRAKKLGDAVSNYQFATISFKQKASQKRKELVAFLNHLKTLSPDQIETMIFPEIKNSWFSKFSPCLPEELSKETLVEKTLDINRLISELKTVLKNN